MSKELPLGKWKCDLLWCPSQCYRRVRADDETNCVLYLRWRWSDPWQAHVIVNASSERFGPNAVWTVDLFEYFGLHYPDHQLEPAKKELLRLWDEYGRKVQHQSGEFMPLEGGGGEE